MIKWLTTRIGIIVRGSDILYDVIHSNFIRNNITKKYMIGWQCKIFFQFWVLSRWGYFVTTKGVKYGSAINSPGKLYKLYSWWGLRKWIVDQVTKTLPASQFLTGFSDLFCLMSMYITYKCMAILHV